LKKILSMLMAVVLLVGILPQGIGGNTAQAASFFIFPNESYDANSPHVVGDNRVTINGTFNGVNASTIKYRVVRVYKNGTSYVEDTSNENKGLTNYTIDNSKMTVTDIPLYSGLNKVEFSASPAGGGNAVNEAIYFDYHDGPTVYNLSATLDGDTVALNENVPAVLKASQSGISFGQDKASIALSGSAPNAKQVIVSVNGGASRTANVSSTNSYQFTVAPLTLVSGKNTLEIQVINGTQKLVTYREVTFFNGKTTFYDTYAVKGTTNSADLSTYPDVSVAPDADKKGTVDITGKVVIPLTTAGEPVLTDYIEYTLANGVTKTGTITPEKIAAESTSAYMTMKYTISGVSGIEYGKRVDVTIKLKAGTASTSSLGFTLRDSSAPYITKVNYLPGYSASTSASQAAGLSSSALDGASIFSLPTAVELLVANGDGSTTITTTAKDGSGKDVTVTLTPISSQSAGTNVQKILYKLSGVSVNGTTTLSFTATKGTATSTAVTATVNFLYGPYVSYTKAYDSQVVQYGQNDTEVAKSVVESALDSFKGQIVNVANESDIVYSGAGQTVFFYINNTLVPLKQDTDKFHFIVVDSVAAYKAMFSGENTVKFVLSSSKTSYENTIKVNLVPTDIPVIPVDSNLGIFPFKYNGGSDTPPKAKDTENFPMSGTNYTTKEKAFNLYGTFDFLDLGKDKAAVEANLSKVATKTNYKLQIVDSEGKTLTWNLSNAFAGMKNGEATGEVFNSSSTTSGDLTVYYDYDKQSFAFIVRNQQMKDSPVVFSFTVYNAGDGGPTATATVEVDPLTGTYNIVRPLTAQKVTNSNFIDVIVDSKNATAVTINKIKAEKTSFDMDGDGKNEFENAYRVTVKDLKANKETKIPVTVTIGDQTFKDTVVVKYVPTNIPGAQFMQTMKNSAKVFEGKLALKFPSGTSLVRRDTDSAEKLKTEVFSDNNLLFAIANSTDGVIDRYDFEDAKPGVEQQYTIGRQYFVNNFNSHFVKASEVYWIDPGIADDISTTKEFDPIKDGQNPYQPVTFPSDPIAPSFYNRDPDNELVPSKRGTMTLSYLPDMAEDAGKLVTVFYFDPELKQWDNVGGIVNASKRTVTVPFDRFGYYVVAKLSYSYTDIVQHSYARNYMETLFAKGIMNATDPDTAFGANQYITRGEFVRSIVKALQIPLNYQGTKHFIDLNTNLSSITQNALYDFRYIETAARAGFVRGTDPQVFSPGDNITRQDTAVIIASATNLKLETDMDKINKGLVKYFKDFNSIDRYARASVLAVAKKGYITGSAIDPNDASKGYTYDPTAKMLRSDTDVILARVMIGQKLLPKM